MKNRLYYENAMTKEFTSQVTNVAQDAEGTYIVLENTAFYPTGGGQPHDTGTISNVEIINVEEVDGEIRHYVPGHFDVSNLLGSTVEGKIDWTRRFDHMQQHTGQHILTAAFVELFNFATVSFHLSSETVTIDLDTTTVSAEQLAQAEALANAIILENRPIETKWMTVEEANTYPLRKALKVTGDVRLVIIPEFDYNGCGGTHPTSTGQVQAIKILSTEKMKQNTRIHFVCGQRVLQTLHQQNQVLTNVAKQLSVPKEEAFEALKKQMATMKETEKALAGAQDLLLQVEANELLKEAQSNRLVTLLPNKSMQQLQKLAKLLTTEEAIQVGLISETDDKYQLVVARGNAASTSMKNVIQTILPLIDGKGGGGDQLAQGGGAKLVTSEELINKLHQAFS